MKNFIFKKLLVTLVVAFIICLPLVSFADPNGTTSPDPGSGTVSPAGANNTKITNPIKANDINTLIKTILEGVLKIGIPIIALAIIYSGFLFVAARGNSEKLGEAKKALLYTVIGAALLIGAWTIAQLISETVLQIK